MKGNSDCIIDKLTICHICFNLIWLNIASGSVLLSGILSLSRFTFVRKNVFWPLPVSISPFRNSLVGGPELPPAEPRFHSAPYCTWFVAGNVELPFLSSHSGWCSVALQPSWSVLVAALACAASLWQPGTYFFSIYILLIGEFWSRIALSLLVSRLAASLGLTHIYISNQ